MLKAAQRGFKFRCVRDAEYADQEYIYLRTMQDELNISVATAHMQYEATLAACLANRYEAAPSKTTADQLYGSLESMRQSLGHVVEACFPWHDVGLLKKKEMTRPEFSIHKDAWERSFGKIDSEEVQKEISDIQAAVKKQGTRRDPFHGRYM